MSVHSLTVHMMDNASALPTCAQQQQQLKLLLIIIDQKLPTRLRDEARKKATIDSRLPHQ
jgi:hypothetical protein